MALEKEAAVVRVAEGSRWRTADARVVVEAWRRSGETLAAFGRRYGLNPERVRRWVVKLEAEEEPVDFHPVRLVERERGVEWGGGEPIEIVLGDGCSVRVPPGFAAGDLARVLSVLAVGAAC